MIISPPGGSKMEWVDLYDENRFPLGKTVDRQEHRTGGIPGE